MVCLFCVFVVPFNFYTGHSESAGLSERQRKRRVVTAEASLCVHVHLPLISRDTCASEDLV